jgi:hypothetical protein
MGLRDQRAEGGGRKTEDGGRKTEDGGRKTEDGGQRTGLGGKAEMRKGDCGTTDCETIRNAEKHHEPNAEMLTSPNQMLTKAKAETLTC